MWHESILLVITDEYDCILDSYIKTDVVYVEDIENYNQSSQGVTKPETPVF